MSSTTPFATHGPPLLDDDELRQLRRPIATARSLPCRAYTDVAWYDQEQERILAKRWVAATFAHRVAGVGDAVPVTVGGQPILIVRESPSSLRAFHNVCAYDGCEVVLHPSKGLDRLVGPYHGWEWSLTGTLEKTPYWDGTPDPVVSNLSFNGDLLPIRCETWLDLVFVCTSTNPPQFAEVTAPIDERLHGADLADFVVARGADGEPLVSAETIPANWKIAFENDVELLHESFVHEEYRKSPYSPKVDANGVMTCAAVADRGLFGLTAPIQEYYDEDEQVVLPLIPVQGRPVMESFHIYDLYPNVQMGFGANHYTLGYFSHDSPDVTRNEVAYYVHRSVADDPVVAEMVAQPWNAARLEDNVVCAATQRGRRSTAMDAGFYSPFWDGLVHAFHNHLADDIVDQTVERGR